MAEHRDDHERHILPIGSENVRRRLIVDPGEGPSTQPDVPVRPRGVVRQPRGDVQAPRTIVMTPRKHQGSLVCMCENGFLANI